MMNEQERSAYREIERELWEEIAKVNPAVYTALCLWRDDFMTKEEALVVLASCLAKHNAQLVDQVVSHLRSHPPKLFPA